MSLLALLMLLLSSVATAQTVPNPCDPVDVAVDIDPAVGLEVVAHRLYVSQRSTGAHLVAEMTLRSRRSKPVEKIVALVEYMGPGGKDRFSILFFGGTEGRENTLENLWPLYETRFVKPVINGNFIRLKEGVPPIVEG